MSLQNFVTRGVPFVGGGVAFSPADVAGLEKWYDASALSTLFQDSAFTTPVTSDGDPVGGWVDNTGSGDDVLQATTAAKPTYRASDAAYNNQPLLQFDGGDELRVLTFGSGGLTQPFTAFLVANFDATPASDTFWSGVVQNVYFAASGFNYKTFAGLNMQTPGGGDINPHIFTCFYNTTASEMWENGNSLKTGDVGTNALNGLNIGTDRALVDDLTGKIAEYLLYDGEVSTEDKNLVQNYLAAKYDMTVTEFS